MKMKVTALSLFEVTYGKTKKGTRISFWSLSRQERSRRRSLSFFTSTSCFTCNVRTFRSISLGVCFHLQLLSRHPWKITQFFSHPKEALSTLWCFLPSSQESLSGLSSFFWEEEGAVKSSATSTLEWEDGWENKDREDGEGKERREPDSFLFSFESFPQSKFFVFLEQPFWTILPLLLLSLLKPEKEMLLHKVLILSSPRCEYKRRRIEKEKQHWVWKREDCLLLFLFLRFILWFLMLSCIR